jgi:hypothetical protein
VFIARYALSPYIKQIRFVFKGLKVQRLLEVPLSLTTNNCVFFQRNLQCLEICMRSMHCKVEFGYQLGIRFPTEGNHRDTSSNWPVVGPYGCRQTSNQQFCFQIRRNLKAVSTYAVPLFLQTYRCVLHSFSCPFLWMNNKQCTNLDFKLPPRCWLDLPSSRILRGVMW